MKPLAFAADAVKLWSLNRLSDLWGMVPARSRDTAGDVVEVVSREERGRDGGVSWSFPSVRMQASTRRACGRKSADRSPTSNERDDYDESRKIPTARARARMWCAASRSISIIIPPQRGHGHEAEGVACSMGGIGTG
jgi:hypothetical protein